MNNIIYQSTLLNEHFNLLTIPLRFSKIEFVGRFSLTKLWKMAIYSLLIIKELLIFKPSLVYFTIAPTGIAFYRDAFFVVILKLFRKKIIYHLHGQGINKGLANPINKKICSFIFKNSSIILLSKLLYSDIANALSETSKIYYLPNGIKRTDFTQQKNNIESKNNISTVLFLSNIIRTKGVFVLIEAIQLLVQEGLQFKVIFVGDFVKSLSKEEFFEKIAHHKVRDVVEYIGPKYGDEKLSVLQNADIFVFPTYKEAFPLVLLEAMQAGLPIISTFEGAIPEIVDEGSNGFLVLQRNVPQLANRMKILLNNAALRKKMGDIGREKFLSHYASDIFENKLKIILSEGLIS